MSDGDTDVLPAFLALAEAREVFVRASGRGLTAAVLDAGGWTDELHQWVLDIMDKGLPPPELYPFHDFIQRRPDPARFCLTWTLDQGEIEGAGGRKACSCELRRKGGRGRPFLPRRIDILFNKEGLAALTDLALSLQGDRHG